MSYVKYMLAELNSDNGGFKFEELARDLIYAEYCRNLVPCTGPVGAGDRGEDARSHENYLLDSDNNYRIYSGTLQRIDKRLIFAFSIRVDWETKLRADVLNIIRNNLNPEKVVFATNQHIVTRERQDKEKALEQELKVEVEILDGSWFELHLEKEHYDLAVKYLGCDQKLDEQLQEMYTRILGYGQKEISEADRKEIKQLESQTRYRSAYPVGAHLVLDLKRLADINARNLSIGMRQLLWVRPIE